jgi:hypothetical protein
MYNGTAHNLSNQPTKGQEDIIEMSAMSRAETVATLVDEDLEQSNHPCLPDPIYQSCKIGCYKRNNMTATHDSPVERWSSPEPVMLNNVISIHDDNIWTLAESERTIWN